MTRRLLLLLAAPTPEPRQDRILARWNEFAGTANAWIAAYQDGRNDLALYRRMLRIGAALFGCEPR